MAHLNLVDGLAAGEALELQEVLRVAGCRRQEVSGAGSARGIRDVCNAKPPLPVRKGAGVEFVQR